MEQIIFRNANSRNTYFSIHNIESAHKYSTGKHIRIGIIDWLFSYKKNSDIYAGYSDISNQSDFLFELDGHGHMMANTLKEIAPDCEVYAINGVLYDEKEYATRIELFEKSIEWAIQNKLQILTYSHPGFFGAFQQRAYEATKKAYDNGVITTFIHNDSPHNLWPYGCFPLSGNRFSRQPDFNIFHYDYNCFFTNQYEAYLHKLEEGTALKSGDDIPFFSFSSMSPVLAAFIALVKQLAPSYSFEEIKTLLQETSYEINDIGTHWYDINPCKHVVDIGKAVETIINKTIS